MGTLYSLGRNAKVATKKPVVRKPKIDRTKNNNTDKSKERVLLTKHDEVKFSPEYFSYLDSNNQEIKFNGIVIKDEDGSYIGKQIIPHKVILEYHPTVKRVNAVNEYFSYLDDHGNEKIFTGVPEFDLENNAYVGVIEENVLTDRIIDIFKEEK